MTSCFLCCLTTWWHTRQKTRTHDSSRCAFCFFFSGTHQMSGQNTDRFGHDMVHFWGGKKKSIAFSVFLLDNELGRAAYIMSFHQLEQSCGSVSDGLIPRRWETWFGACFTCFPPQTSWHWAWGCLHGLTDRVQRFAAGILRSFKCFGFWVAAPMREKRTAAITGRARRSVSGASV